MSHVVEFAVALVLPLVGAAQNPSVGVFMQFDSTPGPALVQTMEREVGDLLKNSGVELDWRLARENHGAETFNGLVFLKFKGSCKADAGPLPASDFGSLGETHALGSTKVDHGRVLPYSEVECDQVRRALAYLRPGAGKSERQSAYGRALARVVAHELYHVLTRTTSHASTGLAKASHSLEELISPEKLAFSDLDWKHIDAGAHENSGVSVPQQ